MSALGRTLPNARLRRTLLAIQDVMGQSGLTTILRQAGLQRYVGALPPADQSPGPQATEYATLMQAIENYYGRGARGTLMRIGYAAFLRLVRERRAQAAFYRLWFRLLPLAARRWQVLGWLARELAGPGGRVTVHRDDQHINVVDHTSDPTAGRQRDQAICWMTVGEIQEALKWGTGQEYEVTEMACRAKGDAACRFEVGAPIG
ncbi:MAG: 4-vinyl reductase [Anaerolineales bacterium]|nr:4-vinyl reductase [Anaerolineales bacterium]